MVAATPDGQKQLIAALDGYRESRQSWSELLDDLKQRGLQLLCTSANVVNPRYNYQESSSQFFSTNRYKTCRKRSPRTGRYLNEVAGRFASRASSEGISSHSKADRLSRTKGH